MRILKSRKNLRCRTIPAVLAVAIGALAIFSTSITIASAATTTLQVVDVSDLAERLLPAVVNISSTRTVERSQARPEAPQGSPFQFFFGPDRPQLARSIGSGFIIDSSGLIVTNNHVIADAEDIVITMQDGTEFEATLLGADPLADLALLKINADFALPTVAWGRSEAAKVGQPVIAIGTPFGLGGSVTTGIISAVQRDIRQGPFDAFIQTDAAINSGNSGGPLFDIDGLVIGINTAIISPGGGSVGIGFSIPQSIAENVVNQLLEIGRVRRGRLGVVVQPVTQQIARSLGLADARGAIVVSVIDNSPADKAGLREGDIILSFAGDPVTGAEELTLTVVGTEIGSIVPVGIFRNGGEIIAEVTIEERRVQQPVSTPTEQPKNASEEGIIVDQLGLAMTPLSQRLRDQFSIPSSVTGVIIADVRPDGPGAEMGLQVGDIIVKMNDKLVDDPKEVLQAIAEAQAIGRESVLLRVNRRGSLRLVGVDIVSES